MDSSVVMACPGCKNILYVRQYKFVGPESENEPGYHYHCEFCKIQWVVGDTEACKTFNEARRPVMSRTLTSPDAKGCVNCQTVVEPLPTAYDGTIVKGDDCYRFRNYRCPKCRNEWCGVPVKVEPRTPEQVVEDRRNNGCCIRFLNNQSCDCLEKAERQANQKILHQLDGTKVPVTEVTSSPRHRWEAEPSGFYRCVVCDMVTNSQVTMVNGVCPGPKKTTRPPIPPNLLRYYHLTDGDVRYLKDGYQPITEHEGKKYLRTIRSCVTGAKIQVDVYDVLRAFGVKDQPAGDQVAHAVKKLLCAGARGKGDYLADLKGVLAAVNRAVQEVESDMTEEATTAPLEP